MSSFACLEFLWILRTQSSCFLQILGFLQKIFYPSYTVLFCILNACYLASVQNLSADPQLFPSWCPFSQMVRCWWKTSVTDGWLLLGSIYSPLGYYETFPEDLKLALGCRTKAILAAQELCRGGAGTVESPSMRTPSPHHFIFCLEKPLQCG